MIDVPTSLVLCAIALAIGVLIGRLLDDGMDRWLASRASNGTYSEGYTQGVRDIDQLPEALLRKHFIHTYLSHEADGATDPYLSGWIEAVTPAYQAGWKS